MKKARLEFEGVVQGVFFRANAQRIGREMKLTGWVRNRKDGTVEALVEGSESEIEEFVGRLKREVKAAQVRKVRTEWSEGEREFRIFEVRGDF
jgi:acylphosphatase